MTIDRHAILKHHLSFCQRQSVPLDSIRVVDKDYTDRIYNDGRWNVVNKAGTSDHLCEPFRSENQYVRGMTESVLDYYQTWEYFDPIQYPLPVQISFERELYSDPCGTCDDSGPIRLLSSSPPKESMEQVTVWGWDRIDAIKVDYPDGQGPDGITTTGRMGDSSGGSSSPPVGGVFSARSYLINSVWVGYGDIVDALSFGFSDGSSTSTMRGLASQGYESYTFSVSEDNHLSSIHINGVSSFYGSADCIVIGYRYIPSTQSMRNAVRRLYVNTAKDISLQDMAAQYASLLEMTSEELIAQASQEGWETQRQNYWQRLRELVHGRKSEGLGSGQGPSTPTEKI